jgi:hypothetical protein
MIFCLHSNFFVQSTDRFLSIDIFFVPKHRTTSFEIVNTGRSAEMATRQHSLQVCVCFISVLSRSRYLLKFV